MKYRAGHVTNSSSSSFTVTVKYFPILGLEHQYPFIGNIIKSVEKFLTESKWVTRVATKKTLDAYLIKSLGCPKSEIKELVEDYGMEEEYEQYLDTILAGKETIYFFSLSSEDESDAKIGTLLSLLKSESWIKVDGEYNDF